MVRVKKGFITALKQVCNKLISKIHRLGEGGGCLCRLPWANRESLFFVLSSTQLLFVLCLSAVSMHRTHTPHLRFCSSRRSTRSYLPPCSFDNDSFSLPLSVSIPLFHCPFTSLRLSPRGINLSLLASSCFVFPRTSSRPAITAYLLSPLPSLPPPCTSVLQGTSDPHCVVWDYGNP